MVLLQDIFVSKATKVMGVPGIFSIAGQVTSDATDIYYIPWIAAKLGQ